jgi:aspartokinase-like uncharacterized kinase
LRWLDSGSDAVKQVQGVKRVVKVGGSLLRLADLPNRLEQWLARQAPATTLLVVGGGRLVDTIREQQQAWGYPDELAHLLALRGMDLNARQLAAACSQILLVREWVPEIELSPGRTSVIECGEWVAGEPVFERSWRTTSDSIAAEIANQVDASELVLLKSALPAEATNRLEYVDPLFTKHWSPRVKVRLVNLASEDWMERPLREQE